MISFFKNFILFVTWSVVILYLSFSPLKGWPESTFFDKIYLDKLVHLFMYSTLSALLLSGIFKQQNRQPLRYNALLAACMGCALYGIIIEILQPQLTMYRKFEWMDMVANAAGSFAGIAVFYLWAHKFQIQKKS